MRKDDRIRLRHMLEAAHEAVAFAEGRPRGDLDHDRMLARAVVRCIEIVGEAAANVSPEGRNQFPDIPWGDIVGMRNRVVHAYYDIDTDRIWDTLVDDLPSLIRQLEQILHRETGDA